MIRQWLADVPMKEFLDAHYGRCPRSGAGTASGTMPALDWQAIGRMLSRRRPDLLVVRSGQLWRGPAPRSLFDAHAMFRDGWSLVLRGAQRHDEALRRVAEAFAAELGGEVQVQLYLTPRGGQSFGWHYDAEHVFIAQSSGCKDYFFRENTLEPRPRADRMPKDMRFELETSPAFACKLAPGDWLYIPAGWWHAAKAESDSFSISVGVLDAANAPPEAAAAAPLRTRAPLSASATPAAAFA